jgi:hypothetical protein
MLLSADSSESTSDVQDFIWRFAVPAAQPSLQAGDNPLVEMVRLFLADFLSIGFLTAKGELVRCDGFAFLNDSESIHRIFVNGVSEQYDTRRSP